MASSGGDNMLRVSDVLSGKQLQQIPTGEGTIYCAAALWGDRVATGHSSTGEIRLWSLGGDGGAAGVLRGHMSTVWSLAVASGTAAQRLLASGSADYSARLWDVDVGTCTAVLRGHTGTVRCLADLGGGQLLSGSEEDNSLRVWNTATGACLAVVPNAHREGDMQGITAACALPGGAATGFGGAVKRWKWDEGALTPDGAAVQLEGFLVRSLAAAPGSDGAFQLVAGCVDGTLCVLDNDRAGGALQQQAVLGGRDETWWLGLMRILLALTVMAK